MRDFQAKRKFKKVLHSWWVITALVLLNILLLKANFQLYGKERYSANNNDLSQKEYSDATLREKTLSVDIARLSTAEGVDLELRRKFRVAKPGEETVVIIPTVATGTKQELEKKPNFWQNVARFFGI